MKNKIALIGLSGTGKTSVGQLVSDMLGWRYTDIDHEIEQRTGLSINNVFKQWGEAAFRANERQVLKQALAETHVVIATGGGIVEDADNRDQLHREAFNVWLHAPTPVLADRLRDTGDRPLLAQDPESRLNDLAQRRAPFYAQIADWMVATHVLSLQQVASDIVRGYQLSQHGEETSLRVTTPGGSYPVHFGTDVIAELPQWLERVGVKGRLWLVSDDAVFPLHGDRIMAILRDAGRSVQSFVIPTGEAHKTLATVQEVYDWLLDRGVERGDTLLALGGGVVGDLVGFVAATVLRGIALVHLPTTVLAMVDSSIGGKTGVDHTVGKNLIGSFWQPRLVLSDTTLLQTLSASERTAGWAEAIKHAIIGDPILFGDLQQHAQALLDLQEPMTSNVLRRAAAYKVQIVSGDEREQGDRILLNYGHTVGHAIEAESDYTLRHGECVAIGMMAAGRIACECGIFPSAALAEQRALLQAFGLPTRIPSNISIDRIVQRMTSDKKMRNARIRWVLPTAIGKATVRDDLPEEIVKKVLEKLKD